MPRKNQIQNRKSTMILEVVVVIKVIRTNESKGIRVLAVKPNNFTKTIAYNYGKILKFICNDTVL